MWGQRVGSLVGAVAGLVFIEVNAGALPDPVGAVVRVVGVLAFLAVLWFSVLRRRSGADRGTDGGGRMSSEGVRVYWFSVLAEVVCIPLGALVLNQVFHRPELVVVWVVAVVGAHFLPFARIFHAPLFVRLAWTLIALAAAGALATLLISTTFAPIAAVLAGVALLGFAVGASLSRPTSLSQ
jgi:hypothetical protein